MRHATDMPNAGSRQIAPESWTEERVELLKKLLAEGLSASQIAVVLGGGATRNAVIGKISRLKLSAHRPVKAPGSGAARKPHGNRGMPKANAVVGRIAGRQEDMAKAKAARAPKPEVEFEAEPFEAKAELFIPVEHRLGLLQLNEHTCKRPIGDPLKPDFYFCGGHAEDGKPYCDFHARRAYHQVDPGRPKVRTPGAGFNQLRRDRAAEREAV